MNKSEPITVGIQIRNADGRQMEISQEMLNKIRLYRKIQKATGINLLLKIKPYSKGKTTYTQEVYPSDIVYINVIESNEE